MPLECTKHCQQAVWFSSIAIFALTETWLSDSFCDGEILPSHFTVYRHDRSSRGGRVLLAVHSSLSSSCFDSPPDLEVVCATVANGSGSDILFCLIYVPPQVDTLYHSRLIQFFESLLCLGHHVIILGDFNAPDICWAT